MCILQTISVTPPEFYALSQTVEITRRFAYNHASEISRRKIDRNERSSGGTARTINVPHFRRVHKNDWNTVRLSAFGMQKRIPRLLNSGCRGSVGFCRITVIFSFPAEDYGMSIRYYRYGIAGRSCFLFTLGPALLWKEANYQQHGN